MLIVLFLHSVDQIGSGTSTAYAETTECVGLELDVFGQVPVWFVQCTVCTCWAMDWARRPADQPTSYKCIIQIQILRTYVK